MRSESARRTLSGFVVIVLLAGMLSLTAIGTVGACEDQVQLPAIARGYDAAGNTRFLDGIVTNDTSRTLKPSYVRVAWAESTKRACEVWICSGAIAPGEFAAFHAEWPCGVPATWTPVVTGYAEPSDAGERLVLTVDNIGAPSVGVGGERTFEVTVTNGNAVPVESVDAVGIERDAASSDFVDTLDSCDLPDTLAAGASATLEVVGRAPWAGATTPEIHVTALEQPTITLSADTTSPAYGSAVKLTMSLLRADGSPAIGQRTLKLFSSYDGERWCDYHPYETRSGSAVALRAPSKPTYYKAVYYGGDDLGCAQSDVVLVKPEVAKTVPQAPPSVRRRRAFYVRGRMCAGAKSGSKPIVISADRKRGSRWIRTTTATAKADSAGRYKKSVKLSVAGTYRIRAYRAGVGYTRYTSLRVK